MPDNPRSTIHSFLRSYTGALLLALISVGCILWLFGFYYEEWEAFLPLMVYGDICNPPYREILFTDTRLLQLPLLAYVSTWFEHIPVFGIWCLGVITLYVSLWFHLALRILGRRIKNGVLLLICSHLFVWTVVGICLVNVNCTRDSILLASVSVLLYFDYYLFEDIKRHIFLLLFLAGCTMRVSTAILALAVLTLFFLCFFRDIKTTARLLWTYWLLSLSLFLVVWLVNAGSKDLGPSVEHYEYAVMSRKAVIPISAMKTGTDTMRYRALNEYYLVTDTANIKPDFIEKIIDKHKYMMLGVEADDMAHVAESLLPLLAQYGIVFLLFYLSLLVALLTAPGNIRLNVVLINIAGWLLIVVLSMKISMNERFMLPWFAMLAGVSFMLVCLKQGAFRTWQKSIILMVSVYALTTVVSDFKSFRRDGQEQSERSEKGIKHIEELCKTVTPVIWDTHLGYLPSYILARKEVEVLKNCAYQSLYRILFYQFSQQRWIDKIGVSPLDWKGMNVAFNNNPEHVALITEDSSAIFLKQYYHAVYQLDFNLVKDTAVGELSPELFVFRIKPESKLDTL